MMIASWDSASEYLSCMHFIPVSFKSISSSKVSFPVYSTSNAAQSGLEGKDRSTCAIVQALHSSPSDSNCINCKKVVKSVNVSQAKSTELARRKYRPRPLKSLGSTTGHIRMKLATRPRDILLLCTVAAVLSAAEAGKFWDDFYVFFGSMNVQYPGPVPGKIVQLGLTNKTGSGFRSKYPFLYGHVSMKLKLVGNNSAGTVTSFYMASTFKKWCELDFEFLGNVTNQPYILQTNVFSEGEGNREQRIYLWFDPTSDYHEYGILWNQKLILFLVDDRVIRVFHNAKDLGVPYLAYQPMYIYSSIWNGESWATRGGREKIAWSQQPFLASYTDFDIANACQVKSRGFLALHRCYRKLYRSSYGRDPKLALTQPQIDDLRWIRTNYVIYDYCTDLRRFNGTAPVECARNWP